jgi:predicted ester cyclase
MIHEHADLLARYEGYLAYCNEHRFDQLGEFVDEHVRGSRSPDGLTAYIDGLKALISAFSDYHWDLQEQVIEKGSIAARLVGRGTHNGPFQGIAPTGRRIVVQELVMYRVADGKITHCWGDLDVVIHDALLTIARTSK